MENQKGLKTNDAFEELISKRGWYKELGITKGTATSIMSRFRKGELTIDKIENILHGANYTVVQEKTWEQIHIPTKEL